MPKGHPLVPIMWHRCPTLELKGNESQIEYEIEEALLDFEVKGSGQDIIKRTRRKI